jgi:hypothetical protein
VFFTDRTGSSTSNALRSRAPAWKCGAILSGHALTVRLSALHRLNWPFSLCNNPEYEGPGSTAPVQPVRGRPPKNTVFVGWSAHIETVVFSFCFTSTWFIVISQNPCFEYRFT